MSGFFAMPPQAWASAREVLPKPWREEWAMADLRYWEDRLRVDPVVRKMPSRRTLETAWGWGSTRVRKLVADRDAWADPFFRPAPDPAPTQKQPTPVRSKAGNRGRTTHRQPRSNPPPTRSHAGANSARIHRTPDTPTSPPSAPRSGGAEVMALAERIEAVVEGMAEIPDPGGPVIAPGPVAEPEVAERWSEIVAELGVQAGLWLRPCSVRLESGRLAVVAPNSPIRDWVVEHYLPRIRELAGCGISVLVEALPSPSIWQRLADGDAELEAEVRSRLGPHRAVRRERTWKRALRMVLGRKNLECEIASNNCRKRWK